MPSLIPECDRRDHAVPMNKFSDITERIAGGYVREPIKGVHKWVSVLDYKSMYPTQIIEKNICFSTLHPSGTTVSPPIEVEVYRRVRNEDGTLDEDADPVFVKRYKTRGRFKTPDDKVGILPGIMKNFWAQREDAKRKKSEAENQGRHGFGQLPRATTASP